MDKIATERYWVDERMREMKGTERLGNQRGRWDAVSASERPVELAERWQEGAIAVVFDDRLCKLEFFETTIEIMYWGAHCTNSGAA